MLVEHHKNLSLSWMHKGKAKKPLFHYFKRLHCTTDQKCCQFPSLLGSEFIRSVFISHANRSCPFCGRQGLIKISIHTKLVLAYSFENFSECSYRDPACSQLSIKLLFSRGLPLNFIIRLNVRGNYETAVEKTIAKFSLIKLFFNWTAIAYHRTVCIWRKCSIKMVWTGYFWRPLRCLSSSAFSWELIKFIGSNAAHSVSFLNREIFFAWYISGFWTKSFHFDTWVSAHSISQRSTWISSRII